MRRASQTLIVFLIALSLYVTTLLPDVLPADSGEFQLVATRAGVAHPPGYPLYTMLGWLAAHLPLGPGAAWRVNFLSAVIAAATVALTFRTGRRLSGSIWGGVVAGLTLGSATTFWATATKASIRPLVAFFTALCLDALTAYRASSGARRERYLIVLAAGLSLGLTHHPSLAFPALAFIAFLLLVDPRLAVSPRRWWRPLLAALPGLLVLAYLPLRGVADAPLASPDLATLPGFLEHVLARGFRGDMFAFATPEHLPARVSLLPTLLHFQFNLALLGAAGLGGLLLLWRDRRLAVLLLGSFVIHTFVTLTYRAPQTVEYEMPAYVSLSLLVAIPLAPRPPSLRPRLRSFAYPLLLTAILAAGVFNLLSHLPSFARLPELEDTRATVEPILSESPPEALILADWHWATPMWFLQQQEGLRPDLEVRYVYPVPGRDYAQVWLERVDEALAGRAVVVTHRFPELEAAGHSLSPLGDAFLVDQRSDLGPMHPLGVLLGERVHLIGTEALPERAQPGYPLEVTLAWEPTPALTGEVALFVHLVGPDGRLWGQGRDQSYPSGGVTAGQRQIERFDITPYLHTPPGHYSLVAGAYRPQGQDWTRLTAADGAGLIPLGAVLIEPSSHPPASLHPFLLPRPLRSHPSLVGADYDRSVEGQLRVYLHWRGPSGGEEAALEADGAAPTPFILPRTEEGGYFTTAHDLTSDAENLRVNVSGRRVRLPPPDPDARYVPIGGEAALVGYQGPGAPVRPGSDLALTFDFLALRPLVHDRRVTTRLVGEGYAWWSADDGTPALGAIPTLKWISGSHVEDRRFVSVPQGATPGGEGILYLGLYDAFDREPLPILDERFVEFSGTLPVTAVPIASP